MAELDTQPEPTSAASQAPAAPPPRRRRATTRWPTWRRCPRRPGLTPVRRGEPSPRSAPMFGLASGLVIFDASCWSCPAVGVVCAGGGGRPDPQQQRHADRATGSHCSAIGAGGADRRRGAWLEQTSCRDGRHAGGAAAIAAARAQTSAQDLVGRQVSRRLRPMSATVHGAMSKDNSRKIQWDAAIARTRPDRVKR